jgi:predicted nucleic acid-binding protein
MELGDALIASSAVEIDATLITRKEPIREIESG